MNQEHLVEDCFALSPASLRNDLARIRKGDTNVNNLVSFSRGNKNLSLNYWSDFREEKAYLVVAINECEPQEILLTESNLKFGTRTYFVCSCGKKSQKLYLLPYASAEFKCRKCHNLRYLLATFSNKSLHGMSRYNFLRMDKLSLYRTKISTPIYKGIFTKKFQRFLRMCGRVGFNNVLTDANALMEHLKNVKQP